MDTVLEDVTSRGHCGILCFSTRSPYRSDVRGHESPYPIPFLRRHHDGSRGGSPVTCQPEYAARVQWQRDHEWEISPLHPFAHASQLSRVIRVFIPDSSLHSTIGRRRHARFRHSISSTDFGHFGRLSPTCWRAPPDWIPRHAAHHGHNEWASRQLCHVQPYAAPICSSPAPVRSSPAAMSRNKNWALSFLEDV